MDQKNFYDVVVIGGGPAGLTAALYLARACYRVLVVEKEQFGGQITITSEVVNYPGVARTSGTELTRTMREQAQKFGAEFLLAEAERVETDSDIKKVFTSRGGGKFPVLEFFVRRGTVRGWSASGARRNSRDTAWLTVPPVTENFLPEKMSLWSAADLPLRRKVCF